MKTVLSFFMLMFILICLNIQFTLSANTTSPTKNRQTDSLNYDIELIKPLVNFNDTNGGFYSEYYLDQFNNVYCGAIVHNNGDSSSTHVYLEVNILDSWNNSVISTYTSDTIALMAPDEIDTLKIQQPIFGSYWYNFRISFELKSDSADQDITNNVDTIASTTLYPSEWTVVSRANVPTDTLNISQIPNFHSGDFIGATLKIPNSGWWHQIAYMDIYLTAPWPDSLKLIGKIYENGNLIYTDTVDNSFYNTPGWVNTQLISFNIIYPDSTYYFGFEIIYTDSTNIPIGIDTSSFHNFQAETVTKIDSTWTTLNFVPLVQLICDPEGIHEIENKNKVCIYPNPAQNQLTVIVSEAKQSQISIYNLQGQEVKSIKLKSKKYIVNIKDLPAGIYFVKVQTNKGSVIKKFVKQ